MGIFINAKTKTEDGVIPPRGKKRSIEQNKAIEEANSEFKDKVWYGPSRVQIG